MDSTNKTWPKLSNCQLNVVSTRVVIIFVAALANYLSYVFRTNMSVTIVAMVNHTHLNSLQNSRGPIPCSSTIPKHNEAILNGPFVWDETLQGHILGSYYYGYIITNLQGGYYADRLGARLLLALVILVSSVMTFLTPFVVHYGAVALIILRIITGLCQGVMTPTIYSLLSYWIPRNERGLALALIQVGGNFGAILTTVLSGIICSTLGWQSVFYISGTFGIFCFIVWCINVYNTPSEHPRISKEELNKIALNVSVSERTTEHSAPQIPWLRILFSMPVWAISIAKFCGAWGNLMLMSKLPSYLKTVLHVSITQNGYITSAVYIGLSVSLTVFGIVSDRIDQKKVLSITASRRLFECSALVGPALCLLLVPEFSCNLYYLVFLLILAMIIFGMNAGGEKPIVVDVAPDFSGTVYGITNAIGSLPGILAPLLVGFITTHSTSVHDGWNVVFYTASGIYIFGAVIFGLFSSAKVQPWGIINGKTNNYEKAPTIKCSAKEQLSKQQTFNNSNDYNVVLESAIDKILQLNDCQHS